MEIKSEQFLADINEGKLAPSKDAYLFKTNKEAQEVAEKFNEALVMEFFTAFYIEYTVRDMDIQTYILLPSYEACQVMIRDNEDMDQYMHADGSVDKWCIRTDKLSQSIRPVLRPE